MNDMTDKPQTNGTGDSKGGCNCDYALAFLLLRGWLAIRAIVTGIEKFGAYKSIQKPLLDASGHFPSPVSSVLDSLLLYLSRILPKNVAGAGVNQLEGIENVVADSGLGLGRQAGKFARQKKVGSLELLHVGVTRGGQLARAFQLALLFQSRHPVAGQKSNLPLSFRIQLGTNPVEEDILVDGKPGLVLHRQEDDARNTLCILDFGCLEDAAGHLVGDGNEVLGFDARAGDKSLFVGLHDRNGNAGRVIDPGRTAGKQSNHDRTSGRSPNK